MDEVEENGAKNSFGDTQIDKKTSQNQNGALDGHLGDSSTENNMASSGSGGPSASKSQNGVEKKENSLGVPQDTFLEPTTPPNSFDMQIDNSEAPVPVNGENSSGMAQGTSNEAMVDVESIIDNTRAGTSTNYRRVSDEELLRAPRKRKVCKRRSFSIDSDRYVTSCYVICKKRNIFLLLH